MDRRSRSAKTPTGSWTDATGDTLVLLELRDLPPTEAVYAHTLTDGERLDHVAHRYYRDATRSWRIADAADALDPADLLAPGRAIRVPPDR